MDRLFAFALAAAAFAGERESRTLGLLDALPVDRWKLWTGKVSFALVSTSRPGLGFMAAWLTTDKWQFVTPWWGVLSGVAVLLMVLGCGFFWSAVMSNALLAAVLAVSTVLLVIPALDFLPTLDSVFGRGLDFRSQRLLGFILGVLGLPASAWLLIRSGPPVRPRIFRSAQPL